MVRRDGTGVGRSSPTDAARRDHQGRCHGRVQARSRLYADCILKGANAGDLPIQQPTNDDLVLNAKVARRYGLQIPPSVLLQATSVIE